MAVSQSLAVDPEGGGLPSVREEKLSPFCVCFPAGITEHMMVFVGRVAVDLQQHDRALLQGFFYGVRRDPRVKTDPDLPALPISANCRNMSSLLSLGRRFFSSRLCRVRTIFTAAVGLQWRL